MSKTIAKNKANNGIIDSSFNTSFNVSIHVYFFISPPFPKFILVVVACKLRICITNA